MAKDLFDISIICTKRFFLSLSASSDCKWLPFAMRMSHLFQLMSVYPMVK